MLNDACKNIELGCGLGWYLSMMWSMMDINLSRAWLSCCRLLRRLPFSNNRILSCCRSLRRLPFSNSRILSCCRSLRRFPFSNSRILSCCRSLRRLPFYSSTTLICWLHHHAIGTSLSLSFRILCTSQYSKISIRIWVHDFSNVTWWNANTNMVTEKGNRTTEWQNYRTTQLQNYRTTELQNCCLPINLFMEGHGDKWRDGRERQTKELQNYWTTERANDRTIER